ncbi:hypothetical protein [Marinovum sp.]|uniref:hypothetical protein n=1 Tax=Marinovum sp. TaxID=2024839 RepID=UPI002B277C99|nr:hypothetical protein [Marinovum sp.]
MRTLLAAGLLALTALPVAADETEGLVLAHDRQARVIVLTDFTVWELPDTLEMPEDLAAGDRVHFTYETAGEDGMVAVEALQRLARALPEGTDGGS